MEDLDFERVLSEAKSYVGYEGSGKAPGKEAAGTARPSSPKQKSSDHSAEFARADRYVQKLKTEDKPSPAPESRKPGKAPGKLPEKAPGKAPEKSDGQLYEIPDMEEYAQSYESVHMFKDIKTDASAPDIPSDYDYTSENTFSEDTGEGSDSVPSSFRAYLQSVFASLMLRFRVGNKNAATVPDFDEDLGKEVEPALASKYYGSFTGNMRLRFRLSLIILFFMGWISLDLPVPGMLRSDTVATVFCLALQFLIMLISLDIVSNAVTNAFKGKIGADTLSVLACLLTTLDGFLTAKADIGTAPLPLSFLSSFTLVGILWSSLLSARGLRKAIRVPAIGKKRFSVIAENPELSNEMTVIKTTSEPENFVRRSEEAPPDETMFSRAAPFILVICMVLAVLASVITKSYQDFFHAFSALITMSVPVTALLCFAFPYCNISLCIFHFGTAIAGWSGLSDIGRSTRIIVSDYDLFPESCVRIKSVRVLAADSPSVIVSYAASIINESGCGLIPSFMKLLNKNNGTLMPVLNFEFMPGGGMRGMIDGHSVICGSAELMRLMQVKLPYKLLTKTTVLLSVDGILYGLFDIQYDPKHSVREALIELMKSQRHPVFAIKDFNITPEMINQVYDLPTDGYDFPPYSERYKMTKTDPEETGQVAAVVCMEGLGPFAKAINMGTRLHKCVVTNLMIAMAASIIGIVTVFIMMLSGGIAALSIRWLFIYMMAVLASIFITGLTALE